MESRSTLARSIPSPSAVACISFITATSTILPFSDSPELQRESPTDRDKRVPVFRQKDMDFREVWRERERVLGF